MAAPTAGPSWQLDEETKHKLFMPWLKSKLVKISDASPDLLADYVYEFLSATTWTETVKDQFIDNIAEFLHRKNAGPLFDDILQRFPPQNETYDIKSGPKTLRGKIHDRIIDKRVNTLLKDIDEFVAGDGLSTTAGQSRKRTHTQRDEYLDSQYGSASSSSKRRAQGNGISTPQNASQTRVGFPSLHNGGTGGAQNGLHRGNNPLNAPQHNFPLLGQASYSVPPSNNFVPNPASNGPPNAPQPSFPPAGQASYPAPAPSNFSMKPGTARSFRDYGEYIVHNHGQELNYGTALKMQEGLAALAKLSYSTIAKMMEKRYGGYSKDQPLSSVLCPAFEANGYCPDGPSCPYTHGDTLTVPPPYVPYNPTAVPYDPTAPPPPLGAEIWEIKSNKSNKPGKQYKQYKQHKQHKQQKANKPRTKPWDNLSYDRDATLAKIAEDQKKHEQRKKKEEIEQALKENINERMNLRSKMRDLGYDPGDDPEVVKAMKEKVARLEAQVAKEEAAANGYYHYEEEIVPSGSYISNSSWVWRPDDGKHAGGEEHAPSGSYVSKSTWVWRPEQEHIASGPYMSKSSWVWRPESVAPAATTGLDIVNMAATAPAAVTEAEEANEEKDLDVADEEDEMWRV